jgi:hypothetical protein
MVANAARRAGISNSADRSMHCDRQDEPDEVRDDTDADHDQGLDDRWDPGPSDSRVRHEAQRSDDSTEGTTDSDQQNRQQCQGTQDERHRRPGAMRYTVDLNGRIRVGERTAYGRFDSATGRCRQRVSAPCRPGRGHSADGDRGAAPERVGGNDDRAGHAVDADGLRIHRVILRTVPDRVHLRRGAEPAQSLVRGPWPVARCALAGLHW